MRNIAEHMKLVQRKALAKSARIGSNGPEGASSTVPPAESIDWLFGQLRAIYRETWDRAHADGTVASVKEQWALALAGLSRQNVAYGLAQTRTAPKPWIPTPGEFRARCLPDPTAIGLPDWETAYEIVTGVRPWNGAHDVVWNAQQECGPHDLRTEPRHTVAPRFRRIYERMCAAVMAGDPKGEIKRPPRHAGLRLTYDRRHRKRTPEQTGSGKAAIAGLRASGALGRRPEAGDG